MNTGVPSLKYHLIKFKENHISLFQTSLNLQKEDFGKLKPSVMGNNYSNSANKQRFSLFLLIPTHDDMFKDEWQFMSLQHEPDHCLTGDG